MVLCTKDKGGIVKAAPRLSSENGTTSIIVIRPSKSGLTRVLSAGSLCRDPASHVIQASFNRVASLRGREAARFSRFAPCTRPAILWSSFSGAAFFIQSVFGFGFGFFGFVFRDIFHVCQPRRWLVPHLVFLYVVV